jgi:AcrR family transcriptional regulator
MARWEPNAPERLATAALELFAERGYENTTVLDIATRAGLAKSTFFRHFQDKRGVLFGESLLADRLVAAIVAAPAGQGPIEAVACGLDVLGREVFTPGYRAFAVLRREVISAHADLREREALKGVSLTASMAGAVERRGVPGLVARVTAQLGALALSMAFQRWTDPGNHEEFGDIARQALLDVQAAAVTAV